MGSAPRAGVRVCRSPSLLRWGLPTHALTGVVVLQALRAALKLSGTSPGPAPAPLRNLEPDRTSRVLLSAPCPQDRAPPWARPTPRCTPPLGTVPPGGLVSSSTSSSDVPPVDLSPPLPAQVLPCRRPLLESNKLGKQALCPRAFLTPHPGSAQVHLGFASWPLPAPPGLWLVSCPAWGAMTLRAE